MTELKLNGRNAVRRLDSARLNLDKVRALESQVWKLKQKANVSMRKVRDELHADDNFKLIVANIVIESHKLTCTAERVIPNIKVDVSSGNIIVSVQYGNWGSYGHRLEESKAEFERIFSKEIPKYLKVPVSYVKGRLWADNSDDK